MQRSARGLFCWLLGLVAALHPLAVSASVLWFGDKDGLHQIDTVANRVIVDVALEPAVAVAVNAADGSVWALTQSRLLQLTRQGAVSAQVSIRDLGTGLGAPRLLVLNPNDASVWAGFENRVLHVDAGGIVRNTLPIAAQDLAVAQDGSLWVLGQSFLQQYDAAASLLKNVALTAGMQRMKHIALDDTGGAIWLAGDKDLLELSLSSPGHVVQAIVVPETTSAIATDVQTGELWLLGQNGLFSYGRDGTPHVSRDLRDFSISNPQSLVFDFPSQAVWVGHQQGLSRISVSGTLVAAFPADTKVVAIAIGRAPLNIVPVVSIVSPRDGALLDSATPLIRVHYDALCGTSSCGFPNSFFSSFSLSALLNGTQVGSLFVFDPATGGATFTPATRLPEGSSTLSAQARDAFGKTSETVSVSFTVDTIAPGFRNVAPPSGSTFSSPSITITGSVDDSSASVSLGGQTQGQNFSFPVTLNSGDNSFTLLARDPAGNTSTFPLSYVFNLPPAVSITSPSNGANFSAPASFTVTANATDSDGTIAKVEFFTNGVPAGVDSVAPYSVGVTNLAQGTYVFTAQATDNRGATTTSAPVTVTVGPPNALPAVRLLSPANGTSFSAPASVVVLATASDSDGTIAKVEFFRDGVLAATTTTSPYTATITGIPAGTHTLAARATDDRGGATTSASATITVATTSLTITSPISGASIAGDTVLVTGRIVGLSNAGVNVSGRIAAIDGFGNFWVVAPLTAGSNTITATLTTVDGALLTQSVTVTATGEPLPFGVGGNPLIGLAPLAVTFTITNPTSGNALFTFDGFGPFSLPAGSAVQLSVTYPAGVFAPNIVITDSGGRTFAQQLVVDSRDPARMDQMFRSIWSGLNNALVAGDKEGAMRYLNGVAKKKFGPVFDVLMPFMSEIVASYSPIAKSSISKGIAEYAVSRIDNGRRRLYLVYFLLDADGVWRVDEM